MAFRLAESHLCLRYRLNVYVANQFVNALYIQFFMLFFTSLLSYIFDYKHTHTQNIDCIIQWPNINWTSFSSFPLYHNHFFRFNLNSFHYVGVPIYVSTKDFSLCDCSNTVHLFSIEHNVCVRGKNGQKHKLKRKLNLEFNKPNVRCVNFKCHEHLTIIQ